MFSFPGCSSQPHPSSIQRFTPNPPGKLPAEELGVHLDVNVQLPARAELSLTTRSSSDYSHRLLLALAGFMPTSHPPFPECGILACLRGGSSCTSAAWGVQHLLPNPLLLCIRQGMPQGCGSWRSHIAPATSSSFHASFPKL